MPTSHLRSRILIVCVVLAVVFAGAALAQDEPVRVKIKKIHKCEGDDCSAESHAAMRHIFISKDGESHQGAHAVFIGEDGEAHQISGNVEMGDGLVWVGEGDGHANIVFGGSASSGAFLGVQMTELTAELRTHFGVPDDAGVMVSKVVEDSAAFRAGVQVGDIITAVDSESVTGGGSLTRAIRHSEPGDTVNLEVWRDGQVQTLSATLEQHAAQQRLLRRIEIKCEDGDCENAHALHFGSDFDFSFGSFDCGEESCDVQVQCDDGSCSCTVNGETADCEALHLGDHR